MSWAKIAKKNIPEKDDKPKEVKNNKKVDTVSINISETPEEIFNRQKGSTFYDFIYDLQFELKDLSILNGLQSYKLYDFLNNYIDFDSSIEIKPLNENSSDSEGYEDNY